MGPIMQIPTELLFGQEKRDWIIYTWCPRKFRVKYHEMCYMSDQFVYVNEAVKLKFT